MPKTHDSQTQKGSFCRCACLSHTKSPAVSGRGLLLLAGVAAEQVDGRRVEAEVQQLLNYSSHPGQGFTPGRALSPGSSAAFKGGSSMVASSCPSPLSRKDIPPVLGWPGGTSSTGAQQRCKTGVPGGGWRQREHLMSAFLFCQWLLPHPLPQVSLIRSSSVPTASVLVWADIQHCLADPK